MAYIDASNLPEEPGDWFRRGNRYRLGQYGIRDDGGTYSTYAVIGGRGYRTGAGLDSFAKSVRHIQGLVEPEDVTERHYSDTHGIGSAERMAGAEPTGSFAKDRESELNAYRSAANNPAFQSALASRYGDAARARSNRQAEIQALADDGDCEAAAYESLFVNHGGPLPDFMYETEYGRKILDAAASHHTESADNPTRGVPPGTLMKSAWPMRAIISMMLSAIHTEATGEMRKLSFYDGLQPISHHFQNAFALMEAMDDGELEKRDAGDFYNIPLYDEEGNEYIYRFNDFMASKYLMQAFPQSRQIPDTMSIKTEVHPSIGMDRKERNMRKELSAWFNDPSGYPGFAITSGMMNNGRARGSRFATSASHESRGGGTSHNAIARQGWTLDTSRPFEFGYVNGYERNRVPPSNDLRRYVSLQARRKKLDELAKRFSVKRRTANEQKKNLSDELDRTRGDIEGKVRELEDYKAKQESIRAQLKEAGQKRDAGEMSPDEYKKAREDADAQLKNVDDNLTVIYRELRELNRNVRKLSKDLKSYDATARAVYDGMQEIDGEMREMEANDPAVKKYLADGKPARLTEWVDSQSMDELYMETLLDLEKENPKDWNATGVGMSRDEDGRLIFEQVTDWRGLNNAYGPEIKADPEHILNTLGKTESETGKAIREALGLRDERRRLREMTATEKADFYLNSRGIDDKDAREMLINALFYDESAGFNVSPKGESHAADDVHAQDVEKARVAWARLQQVGISRNDVDNTLKREEAGVRARLEQITGEYGEKMHLLYEKRRSELAKDILEYTGMNAQQRARMARSGGRAEMGIAMENLGFMVNAIYDSFGGNSDPDAPADTRYRPVVTQERPVRDENGEVVVKELTSEPYDATAGRESPGRIYDAVDARDDRLNPPEEEPRMTEFEAIEATGKRKRGKDRANALSDKLASELGVGQAVPGLVKPSAEEPVDEEADEMNDGADDTNDGADDMNDGKGERKPDDESDGFTKKAKSANDSRRSMSFREVMGEATSRNESAQGLPTWTDMAGADMRGCDVWKDLWRTVYMESGDGTPTKVRMKVIRDE